MPRYHVLLFYPPQHLTVAMGAMASSIMASQVVAAPVAAALFSLDGVAGLRGWQWIAVAEGGATAAAGLLLKFVLPTSPADVRALSAEEVAWVESHVTGCGASATLHTCYSQHPRVQRRLSRSRRHILGRMACVCSGAAFSHALSSAAACTSTAVRLRPSPCDRGCVEYRMLRGRAARPVTASDVRPTGVPRATPSGSRGVRWAADMRRRCCAPPVLCPFRAAGRGAHAGAG